MPAVDKLNVSHKETSAMQPLVASTVATCCELLLYNYCVFKLIFCPLINALQCFDTVGWASGSTSDL